MKRHTHFRKIFFSIFITLSLMLGVTVTPAAAQTGSTTPILVVVNDAAPNKFGRYLGEILNAEGLFSYDVAALGSLTPAQIAQYKVTLLAETPLTSPQATLFTDYVNGGGYLIAMRPDAQIKGLFGLDTASGTQTDGYLQMSGTGPSAGLSTATLQIHGTSDLYTTAAGAVTLAQLYSNATTATAFPAVVTDATGRGTAFTYDLAANVVYTRQGNPALSNVDTDNDGWYRARDVFVNPNGVNHWIDLNKVPIPQADEQQRLLARLVKQAIETSHPMPQSWYFPGTAKTMMIATGDSHANPINYYEDMLDVIESYGGAMTIYMSIGAPDNGTIQMWRSRGHEFGMHPFIYREDSYEPYDVDNLVEGYQVANAWFDMSYSSDKSRTVRSHDLGWLGWTDAAELAMTYGLKLSTDFLAWGPFLQKTDGTWAHGYVDGTGQPMRMIKEDGTVLDFFRQSAPIVDVQLMCYPGYENLTNAQGLQVSQQIIDSSLAGDYAALTTFFQVDCSVGMGTMPWMQGTVAYAQANGVPIWNADRWLGFIESRYATDYSNMAWNGTTNTLTFQMTGTSSGYQSTTILPISYNNSALTSVTVDGSPVSFSTQVIKGKSEAFVVVPAGNHSFTAVYGGALGTPTPTPETPTPETPTPVTPTATLTPSATPETPTPETPTPETPTPVTPTATIPPSVGGSTPILVVVNDAAANKFGRYLGEILRAEGLNSFDMVNLSSLTPAQIAGYKVTVLAETPLSGAQATIFTDYVTNGGHLIAMRPDAQIKNLFGLNTASGTQNNGYLKMSGTGAGQGLNTSTLQIHGTSDRYTLAGGAVMVAELYSNATTATTFPAVVTDVTGRGTAFTYDLASNVVLTRQGNPANGSVDTDGDGVLRTIDLFQGNGGGAPWVDRDRIPVPQADEQQRLFARLVKQAINASLPMPQLWYFPGTAKTMLIPTGDAHSNPRNYFTTTIDRITSHGGRMTIYFTNWGGLPITEADLNTWAAQGLNFGVHPYAAPQPATVTKLQTGFAAAETWFGQTFPNTPESRTSRNHQVSWVGWTDAAEVAVQFGMGMDTNFYHWGAWLQKPDGTWPSGYITGSGQPMKFMKADGTILPLYQQLTQIVDEQYFSVAGGAQNLNSTQAFNVTKALIDASLAGDYAALMTQFHIDYGAFGETEGWMIGTLDYANLMGIPIWNAEQWLNYTETRHDANYTNIGWDAGSKTLSFNLTAGNVSGTTLSNIVPLTYGGSSLSAVTVDGAPASFTIQTIKGVDVAFITTSAGNHSITAVYGGSSTPPTSTPTFTPTATPTDTPTSTPTNTPEAPVTGCMIDDTFANFSLGTNSSTFVSNANGGQVILAPTVVENFDGAALPASWTGAPWNTGSGSITVSGGSLAVQLARAGTTATYGTNTSLEFTATFGASPWQHGGWLSDYNFEGVWAIFSTIGTTNQLYTRTSDGTNTAIPGISLGAPHSYRISLTPTQALFYVDGVQVSTHSFNVGQNLRPLFSDNSADNIPLLVDSVIVTPYAASGTYTSRVHDAGANQTWGAVTYAATGSTVAISARSGNTAVPDGSWSAFTAIPSSGSNLGLSGRYIQYQAALSTANTSQTPALESISFACTLASGGGNQAPTVGANQASVTVNEGQTAANTGTYSDPESNALTLSASVGTVTDNGNGTWSWSYGTNDGPIQSATVTITATDSVNSNSGQTTFALTVNNLPPTATFANTSGAITAGQSAALTFSSAADASTADTTAGFVYSYDCTNDGSFEMSGSTSPTFNCPYPTAGTFDARGRIADKDGGFTDYTVSVTVNSEVVPTPSPTPIPTNTPVPPVASCFTDDVLADFALGTNSSTFVSDGNGGQVILAPTVGENFAGAALPGTWGAGPWSSGGTTTVAGGSMAVAVARAGTIAAYGANTSLEFSATFGTSPWQHGGWLSDFDFNGVWAIFSTAGTNNQLYARAINSADILIPGNWLGSPHTYRIDRSATQAFFYIDGALVATHNFNFGDTTRPIFSDNSADGIPLSVAWMRVSPYASSGTFTSRVFDASANQNWGAVTYAVTGTSAAISARTGNTAVPDGSWSAFTAIPSSGSTLGLSGRYIQYRAALSTANTSQTPALESISFTCAAAGAPPPLVPPANQAPTAGVNQASVTVNEGQTANNTGVYNDPENASVTLSASVGTVTNNGNGTWSWSYATTDGPTQGATVTITVTDNGSLNAQTTFALTVTNVAPSATFSNSTGAITAGQSAALTFTGAADASSVDTTAGLLYSYDCTNDGSFELTASTSPTFNCNYPAAGTFTAAGRIADKDGGASNYTALVEVIAATPLPTATPTETPLPTNTPVVAAGCFIDDTFANFSLGTNSNTHVSTVSNGEVKLLPALSQYFSGTTMPSGWGATNWVTGGSSTLANGLLTVQGSRAYTTTTYGVNRSMEFVATFGAAASQQIGWAGSTAIGTPWAVFSTHNTTNQLYTRTSNGTNTLIPGNWIGTPHKYRIHRTSTQSAFYIDDVLVSTHALSSTTNTRPIISDATLDAIPLTVDWLIVTPYAASGTYTSRIFDAGATTNWGAVNFVTSGAAVTISARTRATPTGSWSSYTTIAASGNSLGRSSRYIQYRAVMSTTNTLISPVLENISFACSNAAPSGQSIQVEPVQTAVPPTATLAPTFTPAPTETVAPVEPTVEAPTAVPTDVPTVEAPTAVPVIPTDVPPATLAPTEIPALPAAPTAAFTVSVDNGAAPLTVQFTNGSAGEVTGYAWAFGDGGSSLDVSPSYTFNTPGVYTVTLSVSGPGGAANAQAVITVS